MKIVIEPDPRRVLGYEIAIKQTDDPLPPESQAVIVELRASQYEEWFRVRQLAEGIRAEIDTVWMSVKGDDDDPGN